MIRRASTDDAKSLLNIYSQYIDTPTTFEEELPTIEEFENRIRTIQDVYPYLVFEVDGKILWFSYAHRFSDRAAYEWSATLSIYVDENYLHQGIGRELYSEVIEILKIQGVRMIYAGYKCGGWRSVQWFEKCINSCESAPSTIIPFSQLKLRLK